MNHDFSGHNQIGIVSSFEDLVNREFQEEMNAVCWQRDLTGNFQEIVFKLQLTDNITEISIEELLDLSLSAQGSLARETILNDLKLLTDYGASPSLNLLKCYQRDDELDFISTDVYSFHVDRSPVEADTYLCTYHGTASDILPNREVQQKILIPEIRQKLRNLFEGSDLGFEEFLQEHFFDLHYQAKPGVKPFNLGTGHLWKLAVDHPGQKALPCVHRAPVENEGEYRLLLIC